MFPSVPKFAFWGWFGKIHIGGQVRAVFQKSLFGKMAKKVCVGYCFIGGNYYIACVRLLCCYCVYSWLLLVAPGCARSCCSVPKTFCLGLVACWWWDLSASYLKWLKWACLGANMAFFDLGASRMCVRVCVWVVVNVADCKKMKKVCKIVAVGVYIIAEWRK